MEEKFDLNQIYSIILSHQHFAPSELLLNSIVSYFFQILILVSMTPRGQKDAIIDIKLLRLINFIKNWVKIDRDKFKQSNELSMLNSLF